MKSENSHHTDAQTTAHHSHEGHDHGGDSETGGSRKQWIRAVASFVLLASGMFIGMVLKPAWFEGSIKFAWYASAYIPVGLPVLLKGIRLALRGDVFTEFILMSVATLGAFYIGQYPEGVAVMLFYSVGELFQDAAVARAKRSIKALLDVRPRSASVVQNGNSVKVNPEEVTVGQTIRIMAGERAPLDGEMLSEGTSFNAAALTGESKPVFVARGGTVLAGMINEENVVDVRVTRKFSESSLARILILVQHATGRKARTELFIRRFARVYTPIVVFLALGLTFIPELIVENYVFEDWLYRALIFLVISCPCALVIAIPLGYFGGIGAGSRHGILFKGSNYLDLMTRVDTVVLDKTGTLTKGVFMVQKATAVGMDTDLWLPLVRALEEQSTHPVARAIVAYAAAGSSHLPVDRLEEIRGHGLKGKVSGREVIAGNSRLLERFGIPTAAMPRVDAETVVMVVVDKKLAGFLTIADEIKPDSRTAVEQLHQAGIRTIMLSGDKQTVVDKFAAELNIAQAFGDLLPEDKVAKLEEIKKGSGPVAFVGEGINDAPVLALADVGIAMGGMGSDAAIQTADVVIQTDQPSKIMTSIAIGKATNKIVWQNIGLAFGVKIIVLILGGWGIATMWEAVFADVGVAMLAILNAVRIQRMRF